MQGQPARPPSEPEPANRVEAAVEPGRDFARVEEQLREAQAEIAELRRQIEEHARLAAVGEVAIAIGHELRQPLSVINNLAYSLKLAVQHKGLTAADDVLVFVERVESQINGAGRVISSLLDFARRQCARCQPTDLNFLIEEQLPQLPIPDSIHVRLDLEGGLPSVMADRIHVERVLHNLVVNAVESLRGRAGTVAIATYRAEGGVIVEVQDDGPGIPAELRDKIFQPLVSTRSGGVGMGLAVSRRLLEAGGGSISVASEPGRGATFKVRLPIA